MLVNLVVNAVDARPEGGELRVRTTRVPGSVEILRHRGGLDPGPHAVLEVSDGFERRFLEKPFSRKDLEARVREALAGPRNS